MFSISFLKKFQGKILARVDFSTKIGFGHLRRVENFIKDKQVIIVCKECNEKYTKYPIYKIKNEKGFLKAIKKIHPKMIVIDNYDYKYQDEKLIKELFPHIKLVVFDDNYKKHWADLIINPNIFANREKYCFPAKKTILVREEFYSPTKIDDNYILIAMGGVDNNNLTQKVFKAIKESIKGKKIKIVTTSANKHIKKLQACGISLIIDAENMADLIFSADLVICTPSVTLNEVFFLNKKFIAIQSAQNQKEMVKFLKRKNYPVLEAWNEEKFKKLLKEVL